MSHDEGQNERATADAGEENERIAAAPRWGTRRFSNDLLWHWWEDEPGGDGWAVTKAYSTRCGLKTGWGEYCPPYERRVHPRGPRCRTCAELAPGIEADVARARDLLRRAEADRERKMAAVERQTRAVVTRHRRALERLLAQVGEADEVQDAEVIESRRLLPNP